MNLVSRTITGSIMIIIGLGFLVFSFLSTFFLVIYGVVFLIIGVFILFNKEEDEIEKIKYQKDERRKK